MNANEWSLITFTILAQMAVGSFLVLGVVHYATRRAAGAEAADRMSDRALLAIGPVLALAMLASLFHLGNPLAAPRAVTNLGSSWLSREIFFGVLFAASGGLFALMQWRKLGTAALRTGLALLAALLGVGLVVSMSMVYLLPTQPAWNSVATPLSFVITALLLGVFAMGAAFVANYAYLRRADPECAEEQCALLRRALRWIALSAIVLLGVQVVTIPLYLASLGAGEAAALESVRLMTEEYGLLLAIRLALLFLGAGILGFFLYQNATSAGRERIMGNLTYAAFAFVLVAEVMGRFLFYASHIRIGV
ncbi:MAG: dimethyl sulfoxide reductase anchor subunit family protein [Chloroflexota bacterium]